MLLTLNTDYLDASDRQVIDCIKTRHDAAYKADVDRQAASCMARRAPEPVEPRVPRRPAGDRHHVG